MPRSLPVSPEKRADVLRLHGEGKGRNAIAAETGVSTFSVSKIVAAAGGSFDRAKTKALTEARKVDLAELRARIAVKMLTRAEEFIDAMDQQFVVFSFGGKNNTYNEHKLESPPTADIRNLMTSAAIAVQRSMELSKFDADPSEGMSAVDEWLEFMAGNGDQVDDDAGVDDADVPADP